MKVDSTQPTPAPTALKTEFKTALQHATPPLLVKKGVVGVASSPSAVRGTAKALAEIVTQQGKAAITRQRVTVEAEAGRLADVRSSHMAQAQQQASARAEGTGEQAERINERAVEAITQELVSAFDGSPSRVANDQPGKLQLPSPVVAVVMQTTPSQSTAELNFRHENQTKAVQAIALIEQIEVFVKTAQRPALALTLNNSLGARVEIERIGPREVALKLVGQRGPPTPDAVSRIREELQARGLKVAALSVA